LPLWSTICAGINGSLIMLECGQQPDYLTVPEHCKNFNNVG